MRQKYKIELLIVIDGLLPKLINEKQDNILLKSIELWNTVGCSDQELYYKILSLYGSRCFMNEIINAASDTGTEYMVAPYASTP